MAKQTKTTRLLKSLKSRPEVRTPIATDMFLPNPSGDRSKGKILTTPTTDYAPVNKKYVDDNAGGGPHAASHELLGADLVDHNNLTNYTLNRHIDWTNSSSNLLTLGTIWANGNITCNAGTIIGALDANTNKIINVVDPTANQEAATKKYVDDNAFAGYADHPHQDVKTTAGPTFAGLTSTDQIVLNQDGDNIITASRVAGNLRLGAGGMTADLIIDTGGNVNIGENLDVGGDVQATTANLAGLDISNDGTKTTFLGTAGDYVRIGDAGTTSHGLASNDDFMVTGRFEVNGWSYFDTGVDFKNGFYVASGQSMKIGFPSSLSYWGVSTNEESSPESLRLALNSISKTFLITSTAYWAKNHDHVDQTNPTLFIHADTNPDDDNTQWMSLTHDQTDGLIDCGKGAIRMNKAVANATLTVTASSDTLDVSGVNTVWVNINSDIILGGLRGGVDGQVVNFAIIGNFTNHVRFEHAEGIGGTQDFINHTSADEDIDHGGCTYVCNGTNWYDISHAKHV